MLAIGALGLPNMLWQRRVVHQPRVARVPLVYRNDKPRFSKPECIALTIMAWRRSVSVLREKLAILNVAAQMATQCPGSWISTSLINK